MIRLDTVSVRRGERLLVDGVCLTVSGGELVVVEGARGTGKTALLDVAALVRAPDAGSVCIGERNVTGLQPASLPFVRRNIGHVAARPAFIDEETALENVMLALGARGYAVAAAEDEARSALLRIGVDVLADIVVARLSAGERQLVAVARALAGAPPVLVLDEPAAGLGTEDRRKVVEALTTARVAGACVLCATSDDALAADLADLEGRRVILEDGRLIGATPTMSIVRAVDTFASGRPPRAQTGS